jgi:hypothetical protein
LATAIRRFHDIILTSFTGRLQLAIATRFSGLYVTVWSFAASLGCGRGKTVGPEDDMRFFARVLSLIFLVFAVLAGLVDAIQTVAASQLVLTPLIDMWSLNSPDTLAFVQSLFSQYVPVQVWDEGVVRVLDQPASAVFLMLSLLFYLAAYRRPRPAGRFAA